MTNSLHNDAQSLDTQSSASNLGEMRKVVANLPKILLHDYLDGGLRPQAVTDLTADCGYTDQLPATDADELGKWFIDIGNSNSLPSYLIAFAHTCTVMQTAKSLTRVTREAVEGLADNNVIYAELRPVPENHLEEDLDTQAVIDALIEGLAQGEAHAVAEEKHIIARLLVCAMRQNNNSKGVVQLVISSYGKNSDGYVVGSDIAGPENGFPPANHAEAFIVPRKNLTPIIIHADEDAGVDSLQGAVVQGIRRLSHGVRIYKDFGASLEGIECQEVTSAIRNRQISPEIRLTSNAQTGVYDSVVDHPFSLLDDMSPACTINANSRLIGAASMTRERMKLVENFGYSYSELFELTSNTLSNAFVSLPTHKHIMDTIIHPVYLQLTDNSDEDIETDVNSAGFDVEDKLNLASN